jgi:bacteriocin biosynthesis cyclodehydratase domain-containing protein
MNRYGKSLTDVRSSRIALPQLKSTVIPIPLAGERLALHRGPYKAEHQLMVLDDPGGLIAATIGRMDGKRTIEQIAAALNGEGISIGAAQVRRMGEMLAERGVVADAGDLSTAGMSAEAAARYSRNINAWAALSVDGRTAVELQREVGRGHVLILGVGGVGTSVALALAMAGCGRLTLVDFDRIELQNLNRQLLFNADDVGKAKVDVAKESLLKVNPEIEIATIDSRLTSAGHVRELIESVKPDFVSAAADRPTVAIDRWINDACFALGIPFSSNSVSGNTALFWTKVPGMTGCFNCDDLWARTNAPDQYEVKRYREKHDLIAATSAFSFTAMTIGAMTASDIVRSLVKWPVASAGRAILVDFSTLRMLDYERPAHPDCPTCGTSMATRSGIRGGDAPTLQYGVRESTDAGIVPQFAEGS